MQLRIVNSLYLITRYNIIIMRAGVRTSIVYAQTHYNIAYIILSTHAYLFSLCLLPSLYCVCYRYFNLPVYHVCHTRVGLFFPPPFLYIIFDPALIKALEQTMINLFVPFSTGNRATIPHTLSMHVCVHACTHAHTHTCVRTYT